MTRSSSNERRELLIKQASRKNTAVGRLLASLQRKEEEDRDTTKEMVNDGAENFLMRDHRMAPVGKCLIYFRQYEYSHSSTNALAARW